MYIEVENSKAISSYFIIPILLKGINAFLPASTKMLYKKRLCNDHILDCWSSDGTLTPLTAHNWQN